MGYDEGERQQSNKIGGMWLQEKNGKKFFSGEITVNGVKQRFVVFRNDRKQPGERTPDYNVLAARERQQ